MPKIMKNGIEYGGGDIVTYINNDATNHQYGISYYKYGKLRMLTIVNGGIRTINDLTSFINQYVSISDLPKTNVCSSMQIIDASVTPWNMELGILVLYSKDNPYVQINKYILYKAGEEIPRDSTLIIGGQIVWFTE